MYDYFHRTDIDAEFYEHKLKPRLPKKITDAHAHFNLPEHVKNVTRETIEGDWALESGLLMSYEDSRVYAETLLPGNTVEHVALPWPLFDADTAGNNEYIASLIARRGVRGLFTVRPEYTREYVERRFAEGGFSGFKPYPYMASRAKGAEVSIFDFMPKHLFETADRLGAPVLLHLPRAGRLADRDNIYELRTIMSDYPNVKPVIAHFGRCFCVETFKKALSLLGGDAGGLWFDTAAVLNPEVYETAFEKINFKKILFGTDLPIMLWHGRREWRGGAYFNLCRENFSWNTHKYPDEESGYTFFVYEQLNNILNVVGGDAEALDAVFGGNAAEVYGVKKEK